MSAAARGIPALAYSPVSGVMRWFLPVATAIALSACSGNPPTAENGASETTTTTATTMVAEGPRVATGLVEARGAVVRIEATGAFFDAAAGRMETDSGSGSGFVVSPDGHAVTNSHVVAGAGVLEVYVDGESEPRNARVVGISECADLAVIDISGSFDWYLEWDTDEIVAGTDVYALGFPLGDAEYTVLDGVVSKARANGETSWASIPHVIEHTADVLPGSSGGPLVTAEAKVVGVVYADDEFGQAFAISRDTSRPLADRLSSGDDVDSLGINGEAFAADGVGGIVVVSVESGSAADRAGLRGGDVITQMEGLEVGSDGTMTGYCDIVRSHAPDDVLAIEVYRSTDDQWMAGRIGAHDVQLSVAVPPSTAGDGPTVADGFQLITDDTGVLEVEVPVGWSDIDGSGWFLEDGEWIGLAITASPDIDGFDTTWDVPGVFFGLSEDLSGVALEEVLDALAWEDQCDLVSRDVYDDGYYLGMYDVYERCGGVGTEYAVIVAEPPSASHVAVVEVQIVSEADYDALDRILASFWAPDGP